MKAFKQISFKREKRLVMMYASALSILGFLVIFTPVLAQDIHRVQLVPRGLPETGLQMSKPLPWLPDDSTVLGMDEISNALMQDLLLSHQLYYKQLDLLKKAAHDNAANGQKNGTESVNQHLHAVPGPTEAKLMEFREQHYKLLETYFGSRGRSGKDNP